MQIDSITIKNLLSFKDVKFNFKKYNVIVGPNNAGKTNLVRLLEALVNSNLSDFSTLKKMKHSAGVKSEIRLAVKTNDEETRLFMQALIDKNIKEETDLSSWRNFTIGLGWRLFDTSYHVASTIIFFQNRVVVSTHPDEHYLSYYASPDMLNFEQCLDKLCNMDRDQLQKDVHKGSLMPVHKERVRELVTDGPSAFFSNMEYSGILGKPIDLHRAPEPYKLELAEYIDIEPPQSQFSFLQLISKVIRNSFLRSDEIHPIPSKLTDNLYRLKNENELAYTHLQKSFTTIFPDAAVRVEQNDQHNDNSQTILITERKRTFDLTNSASGYLEAIYILYTILNHTERTIFLDEPEVHFHPAKIKQIGHMLSNLTKESGNQITVITHSPKFVDHGLLTPDSTSLLTMVAKINDESLVASPKHADINLKPHMIVPDVFFANAVFLVEGARDEAIIKAISDRFDGLFNKYEIVIVDCGGVGGIKPYICLLDAYSIKYYGIADKEYRYNDTITVLAVHLEDELQKITTLPFRNSTHQPKKPDIEVYYNYMSKLLETESGFEDLKKTKIWSSIENVMDGLDICLEDKVHG